MRVKLIFFSLFTLFTFVGASIAQNSITEADYYSALRQAYGATEIVFPRRETTIHERFKGGKLIERTTLVQEFYSSTKKRRVETTTIGSRTTTEQVIELNGIFYCREGKARWKKSKRYCGRQSITGFGEAETERYTVGTKKVNGIELVLYSQYRTDSWEDPETKKTSKSFYEERFFVKPDGTFLRREGRGGNSDTSEITSKDIYSYEYGVVLTELKAPIK